MVFLYDYMLISCINSIQYGSQTGQAGDDDEAVAREGDVDVLEVVLARATHDKLILGHVAKCTRYRVIGTGVLCLAAGERPLFDRDDARSRRPFLGRCQHGDQVPGEQRRADHRGALLRGGLIRPDDHHDRLGLAHLDEIEALEPRLRPEDEFELAGDGRRELSTGTVRCR